MTHHHSHDRLKGSIPPVITPFANGEVDYGAYRRLVEFQVDNGSHGILVNGTSAEPSCLSVAERNRLVTLAMEAVNGRIPVVAANRVTVSGGNATTHGTCG